MRPIMIAGVVAVTTLFGTLAESQVVAPIARSQLAVPTDPASQLATLQQQVAALQQQNATLQAAVLALQVKTQWITANGSDFTLNVPGLIMIRGGGQSSDVRIQANGAIELRASASAMVQSAGDLSVRSGGNTSVAASGTASIWGATVQLNRNGSTASLAPAAVVGSMTTPSAQGAPGKVVTGSSTVLIAP
jgi:hypothetical protein